MKKTELDQQLKTDSELYKFTIEGDYLIFDKSSNLSYAVCQGLKLGDLLTANPISYTKLNKNLLLLLVNMIEQFNSPINVVASYRSHEYDLLCFGLSDSKLYTRGDALLLNCDSNLVPALADIAKKTGVKEVFNYPFGVHIGYSKVENFKDFSLEPSNMDMIKKFVLFDKMKNVVLLAAAAAAGWFFFIKK